MQEAEPLPWFYTCSAILLPRLTRLLMCLHSLLYRGYSCASFARPRLPINLFRRLHMYTRCRFSSCLRTDTFPETCSSLILSLPDHIHPPRLDNYEARPHCERS
ncbi:hypothetical protein KC19_7G100100 [Ceratodon purpureus]|uniref:Uncharacterized protein n=1 Tax=Ceratodon purpureus TaxID=3225 RepID=A0A8T0H6J7_CERPU|nr:hypothetical protein KC19_7G100100 [Ceratodon purpureus]